MPGLLDPSTLAKLDHATLYRLRMSAPPELQNILAGYEHRAFAREAVRDHPLMAASIGVAIPLYQAAKMIPSRITGMSSRSVPSANQAAQGYLGIRDGIIGAYDAWRDKMAY